jgi:hypothetical protein
MAVVHQRLHERKLGAPRSQCRFYHIRTDFGRFGSGLAGGPHVAVCPRPHRLCPFCRSPVRRSCSPPRRHRACGIGRERHGGARVAPTVFICWQPGYGSAVPLAILMMRMSRECPGQSGGSSPIFLQHALAVAALAASGLVALVPVDGLTLRHTLWAVASTRSRYSGHAALAAPTGTGFCQAADAPADPRLTAGGSTFMSPANRRFSHSASRRSARHVGTGSPQAE